MRTTLVASILALAAALTAYADGDALYVIVTRPAEAGEQPLDVGRYGGTEEHRGLNRVVARLSESAAEALAREATVRAIHRLGATAPVEQSFASRQIRPESIQNWSSGTMLYDGAGNIHAVGTDRYAYDAFGRLVTAKVYDGTVEHNESYVYDRYGNRTSTTTDGTTTTMPVSASTNRLTSATYDESGNLTSWMARTWEYDSANVVRRTTSGAATRYLYTASDERIAAKDESANDWRWTLRNSENQVVREYRSYGGPDGVAYFEWIADYHHGAGGILSSDHPATEGGRRYYHRDHLGSVRMVTNQDGRRISRHVYLPFGIELTPSQQLTKGWEREDPRRFTGHERDYYSSPLTPNTDYIDYMHARYYMPGWGRFLSVDPVLDIRRALQHPQAWNRYAYVENNPLNKIDPTGAYQEDVHHGLTNSLAMAAGFDSSQAAIIAGADQGVDDDPRTQPLTLNQSVLHNYHFTSTSRRDAMWGAFTKNGSLKTLGVFLHAFQDSYSHAGYKPPMGHVWTTAPDLTHTDPSKTMRMARDTYQKLTSAGDRLGISSQNRVAWRHIEKSVLAFSLARSAKEKRRILDELNKYIVGQRQQ